MDTLRYGDSEGIPTRHHSDVRLVQHLMYFTVHWTRISITKLAELVRTERVAFSRF